MSEAHEVQDRLKKPYILSILERYLTENPIDSLPYTVEQTEIAFQVPLTDDIVYCGRIDLQGRMKHSDKYGAHPLVLSDTKTTRSITVMWEKKWKSDTQISGYIYAAQEHTGLPITGMYVEAIEIPDPLTGRELKDGSRSKCKEHGIPYDECGIYHAKFRHLGPYWRTQEQLEAWKLTAIRLARKYRDLHRFKISDIMHIPMEGQFTSLQYTNACVFCDLDNFCNVAERPVHIIDNYLKYDPWWCMPEMLQLSAATTEEKYR